MSNFDIENVRFERLEELAIKPDDIYKPAIEIEAFEWSQYGGLEITEFDIKEQDLVESWEFDDWDEDAVVISDEDWNAINEALANATAEPEINWSGLKLDMAAMLTDHLIIEVDHNQNIPAVTDGHLLAAKLMLLIRRRILGSEAADAE